MKYLKVVMQTMTKKSKIEFEDLDRDTPKYPNQFLTFSLPIPMSV